MTNQLFSIIMSMLLSLPMTGISQQELITFDTETLVSEQPEITLENESVKTIKIIINDTDFTATLEDNETVQAFINQLPITMTMQELNGNEKYDNFKEPLPTDVFCPGDIHAGDIMLYGTDCVVLFYKSFSTSYSYTPLGKIDDPNGLKEAVGTGAIEITFQEE